MSKIDWSKAPEGATHFGVENEFYFSAWYKVEGEQILAYTEDGSMWREATDGCVFPRVPSLSARPEQWAGEGPPPVGTVCEWYDGTLHRWFEVVIAYSSSWVVVVRGKCSDGEEVEISLRSESAELRPLHTPEQIAADERKKIEDEIQDICTDAENSGKPYFKALYEAGYRKQVAS